jgi:hypothetical protein
MEGKAENHIRLDIVIRENWRFRWTLSLEVLLPFDKFRQVLRTLGIAHKAML